MQQTETEEVACRPVKDRVLDVLDEQEEASKREAEAKLKLESETDMEGVESGEQEEQTAEGSITSRVSEALKLKREADAKLELESEIALEGTESREQEEQQTAEGASNNPQSATSRTLDQNDRVQTF